MNTFCPECGTKNETQSKFCMNCGHKFAPPKKKTQQEIQKETMEKEIEKQVNERVEKKFQEESVKQEIREVDKEVEKKIGRFSWWTQFFMALAFIYMIVVAPNHKSIEEIINRTFMAIEATILESSIKDNQNCLLDSDCIKSAKRLAEIKVKMEIEEPVKIDFGFEDFNFIDFLKVCGILVIPFFIYSLLAEIGGGIKQYKIQKQNQNK